MIILWIKCTTNGTTCSAPSDYPDQGQISMTKYHNSLTKLHPKLSSVMLPPFVSEGDELNVTKIHITKLGTGLYTLLQSIISHNRPTHLLLKLPNIYTDHWLTYKYISCKAWTNPVDYVPLPGELVCISTYMLRIPIFFVGKCIRKWLCNNHIWCICIHIHTHTHIYIYMSNLYKQTTESFTYCVW